MPSDQFEFAMPKCSSVSKTAIKPNGPDFPRIPDMQLADTALISHGIAKVFAQLIIDLDLLADDRRAGIDINRPNRQAIGGVL